jgi:hypothetical protein
MDYEEAKEKIVEGLSKKKSKTKFYFNDLAKILGEKPRAAKKKYQPNGNRGSPRILVQWQHVIVRT